MFIYRYMLTAVTLWMLDNNLGEAFTVLPVSPEDQPGLSDVVGSPFTD